MTRSLWLENPILTRELRTRMRGARAFWLLFIYVAVLACCIFITYLMWWNSARGNLGAGNMSGGAAQVGRTFYGVLFTTQAFLILLITPSLTSGGISIEKEQRTFELLTVSQMPRRDIVLGKLLSTVFFVTLLLTASLPLVSLSFLLGGVSPGEVMSAYGLLLVCAMQYGAVGLACSSVAQKTTGANVMAYSAVGLIFVVTLPLSVVAMTMATAAPGLVGSKGIGLSALNPLGALAAGTLTESYFHLNVPAWATAVVINGLFSVILVCVAIHRLDYPRTDRSGLLRLLTTLLVALLAFCVYGMFLPGNSNFIGSGTFVVATVVTLLGLIPLVSLFATGDGLPRVSGIWGILDPRRLAKGEAPSGALYGMLLAGLCGLVMAVGATFGTPVKGVGSLTLLAVGVAGGFGCLGILASAITGNRWSAMSLVAGLMVVLYLVPLTSTAITSDKDPHNPWNNVIYLTPLGAAVDIAIREGSGEESWTRLQKGLLFSGIPPWAVTTILNGLFGAACLASAAAVHASKERKRQAALATESRGNER